jgi:hypothetical protein
MKTAKMKMALKMMSNAEREKGISPFDSNAWMNRKLNRQYKEVKKHEKAVAEKSR